jgi:hypothetical protein
MNEKLQDTLWSTIVMICCTFIILFIAYCFYDQPEQQPPTSTELPEIVKVS